MIYFFRTPAQSVIATSVDHELTADEKSELCWLYGEAKEELSQTLDGFFVGPRREMITPWSTNAVEITQNMAIKGVQRIEEYFPVASEDAEFDPMLQRMYDLRRCSRRNCSRSAMHHDSWIRYGVLHNRWAMANSSNSRMAVM